MHSSHGRRMSAGRLIHFGCRSLRGEKCSKIVLHPSNEETREHWLDQLAIACDSDESDDEYEVEPKANASDVASSAKEFDARQIISANGQDDTEREV